MDDNEADNVTTNYVEAQSGAKFGFRHHFDPDTSMYHDDHIERYHGLHGRAVSLLAQEHARKCPFGLEGVIHGDEDNS